jgi:hypothetical protein
MYFQENCEHTYVQIDFFASGECFYTTQGEFLSDENNSQQIKWLEILMNRINKNQDRRSNFF